MLSYSLFFKFYRKALEGKMNGVGKIIIKKARVHNLKGVDLELETGELIVFTGVSGSGKSSLAFDTIYAEGQRRYIESLSAFARRHIGEMRKCDVEDISGLSPTISIEQKSAQKNPRSTVGTMTEIYDYLRVLFARVATPYCPVSGEALLPQSKERILKTISQLPLKTKIIILAPFARAKKGEFKDDFRFFMRKGYTKMRIDTQFVDVSEEIELDKSVAHDIDIVIDRLTITEENNSRLAEAIFAALELTRGTLIILNTATEEETLFSTIAYAKKSALSYPALEPQDFSFNSLGGMCPTCHGLGTTSTFDLERIINPDKSISQDCCEIASSYATVRYGNIYDNLARLFHFSVKTPWRTLSEKAKHVFLFGIEKKWTAMHFVHPEKRNEWTEYVAWRGVIHEARARYLEAKSDTYKKRIEKLMKKERCPICQGARLKPYSAAAQLQGKKIHEICQMTVAESLLFFSKITLSAQEMLIAEELLKEIEKRLHFLKDVGLHYLSLERTAPTLSGGESQRVRLASQVGAGLVGITYVLDEPSIGLHPRDNLRLIHTLTHLRDIGNTVIVVEHDEETIRAANRIVDVGPLAGQRGGEILVNGTFQDLIAHKDSLTGAYLSGREKIAIPSKRRVNKGSSLKIIGATHHNLKNIDVEIPLGLFVAVAGVSGSGKSSLITDILHPALSRELHGGAMDVGAHVRVEGLEAIYKVIAIDQSPIGRSPRSNPATYIKLFDEIRTLFSTLPQARAKGFSAGRFSFNVKEGSCEECRGMGMIKVDMDFMEEMWVNCSLCEKRRFDEETLSITYNGKNIFDVLEMSVEEASSLFHAIPSIVRKLEVLTRVGLSYLTLGQSATTLSGGEAQRIKLAKELSRPSSGNTLYILDEPTTGLHFHDIKALLSLLHELVDKGNTVLVIEHNTDVLKTADWILELGPEGGGAGGYLVAHGTPEELVAAETATGEALKTALSKMRKMPPEIKKEKTPPVKHIEVVGAEQNNLKSLSLKIPREKITILTGPSGSGKSSLAFDTVYAEGQRRYIESLSPYARQFVEQCPKPKLSRIEGLSPAIAIEQKSSSGNERSTVGTMTEVYDYLRILFARAGTPHSPQTGEEICSITAEYVIEKVMEYPAGEKIVILSPLNLGKESLESLVERLRRQGFLRLRLNKEIFELEEPIPFDKKRKNEIAVIIDRIRLSPESKSRLAEAIEQAVKLSKKKVLVAREDGSEAFFNLAFAAPSTGQSYPEITPHTFSFNSQEGMCPDCEGLGAQYGAFFDERDDLMSLSPSTLLGALTAAPLPRLIEKFFIKNGLDPHIPLSELSEEKRRFFLRGEGQESLEINKGATMRWRGIQETLEMAAKIAKSEIRSKLRAQLKEITCPTCQGERLSPLARAVTVQKQTLPGLCRLPIDEALAFIEGLQTPKILEEVMAHIKGRLSFLVEVGLHYLSLERKAPTLSNGEVQRIRLARQLGSSLTGVLYVLDEPTIGLHPHDISKLHAALAKLKALGNTLLLVEHDPLTIAQADYLFDFGPGAGKQGGHLLAEGTYKQILKNPRSLTGAYLSGKKSIPYPTKRRKGKGEIHIEHASTHNLKDLSFSLPLSTLTCITGVSGSGKSTLLQQEILPHALRLMAQGEVFDKVIVIDQNPIGHTVRADVSTYTDLVAPLRLFYSTLATARAKGLQPKHFSCNHRQGMCTTCYGLGYKKVEMLFLPTVKVTCEACKGLRLNTLSLEVRYENKNFGELLEMGIEEVLSLFSFIPKVKRICDTLLSVGLGYLTLGQEIATLSSGEAQRIKLSYDLAKRHTGKTLYLLDEPTTGLHSDDIAKLLSLLHRLVDKGNTLIAIEHNLDFLQNADHLIELGPTAGATGGYLIASGTPEHLLSSPHSLTAPYLKELFK